MATYRRIAAVKISIDILRFLGDQREPVSGKEIAEAVETRYGTVMCHLATLCDDRFVERRGDLYALGPDLALIWARRKAHLEDTIDKATDELNQLEV